MVGSEVGRAGCVPSYDVPSSSCVGQELPPLCLWLWPWPWLHAGFISQAKFPKMLPYSACLLLGYQHRSLLPMCDILAFTFHIHRFHIQGQLRVDQKSFYNIYVCIWKTE